MEAHAVTDTKQIRVLIADDSPTVRLMLCRMLEADPNIKVIATVGNGKEATEQVALLKPDLVTMDVQMPVMDGLDAIEHIMAYNPVPILVVSSVVDKKNTANAARALGAGAVDVMPKPTPATMNEFETVSHSLQAKVKMLSRIRVITHPKAKLSDETKKPVARPREEPEKRVHPFRLVAVGSSTGGPQALFNILSSIPADTNAAFVIVQHIAQGFTDGLVEWLSTGSELKILKGYTGHVLSAGEVVIAPDAIHMIVSPEGVIRLVKRKFPGPHMPSIDVLFESVSESYGRNCVGVILTGMGRDGALGTKAIHDHGGYTIAQDKETSAIFSMAKEAIQMGAVDEVISLPTIGNAILRRLMMRV